MGNYQSASADDRSFVTDSEALGNVGNKIESLQGRHSSHTDSLAPAKEGSFRGSSPTHG